MNEEANSNNCRKALVIAVSEYDRASNLKSLEFCKNDGLEMYDVLKRLGYDIPDNRKLIGSVNSQLLKNAIYDFLTNEDNKPDDTLLFYYSGHGIPDKRGKIYLAPSDIDSKKPFISGFAFDDLTESMLASYSLSVVTILDSCFSGSLKIGFDQEGKGAEVATTNLANSIVDEQSEKLKQGSGKCLLAASQGYEEAFDRQEKDHSIFTYYLLEGLNGHENAVDERGNVTYDTLGRFINNQIARLPSNKRPNQTPLRKGEISGDIVLGYYPHLVKQTLSSGKMDITSIIDKGLEFKNIAEYDNALECFNKAIAINPNNYVPYKNKGDILFKQGNVQAAIDEFDKAISVNPEKDHMTYYLKGTVYFKQERYNEAIQCYNETLSINPKYLNAIMNKGLALFKLDDYSQAIVSYDEALKINPKHIYSLNGKGIALCKLGQYNEAISIYNKVLEIDANNEEAIKNKNIATNVAGFTVMPENPISIGKKAIVIGINEYQSLPAEKNLQGAQNDANEIYNILRKNGYTIEDSDFLVGNRATHRAISKSINNAFRKRSSYGTILFYYSGLGLVDDNKDAYIAPYDIDPLDPFVNGISVDELNRIMDNSKNNSKFVTIFDCCYVDNAIEDAKGVTELVYKSPIGPRSNGNVFEVANKGVTKGVSEGLVILNDSFKKIANPDINKPVSASKIIIASSQADSAHEKIFNHNDNSHHHGIFSYYLIEGLLGKASPTEEGDITPDKIFKYIEAKMKNDGTQLIAYGAQVQQDVIRIALASYGEKDTQIKEIFEKANDSISTNDFASLIYAAKLLWVLEDVRFNPYLNDSQKYEYGAIRKKLESSLSEYGNDLYNWFIDNQTQYAAILFTKQFKESRKNIYSELTTLCENLTYEIVANISQQDKRCLMAVFRFMKSPKNEDEKLEELEREVKRLV